MKRIEKVKAFVKKHKQEVIIGASAAGIAIVSGIVFVVTKKKIDNPFEVLNTTVFKCDDLEKPDTKLGNIMEFWQDKCGKNLIMTDVSINDLGALGQEFLEVDGITNDTKIDIGIMTFKD